MQKQEILCTTFGEMQDMISCEAIAHGFAEEDRAPELTQEEMLELE